jgi:hypothetical protein
VSANRILVATAAPGHRPQSRVAATRALGDRRDAFATIAHVVVQSWARTSTNANRIRVVQTKTMVASKRLQDSQRRMPRRVHVVGRQRRTDRILWIARFACAAIWTTRPVARSYTRCTQWRMHGADARLVVHLAVPNASSIPSFGFDDGGTRVQVTSSRPPTFCVQLCSGLSTNDAPHDARHPHGHSSRTTARNAEADATSAEAAQRASASDHATVVDALPMSGV